MKITSFNCRGLARPEKKLTLRKLFHTSPIDIILLQETLDPVNTITYLLEVMFVGWKFIGIYANGRSGGLALGYNSRTLNLCNCWGGLRHIGADIFSINLGLEFQVINVYGPCQQRPTLWDHLLGSIFFRMII